ncbi:hypothetical protein L6452_26790 [Arctium lappa]|uniref:Uncharacterized protein n=1 Tax=Arctium lappa TaxID=4217 RepID=A0ACB8ZVA9_ARCLA|nr:hypothetical protein L6452_26790 [Arctium lappa]
MGRSIVDRESPIPAKRSRVWRSKESYDMLIKGKGSETMKGLALEMGMVTKDDEVILTDILERLKVYETPFPEMDQLKLLQLNYVNFRIFINDFSEHLRWLCWFGIGELVMPSNLLMGNMVALDMSYSSLRKFKPPGFQ